MSYTKRFMENNPGVNFDGSPLPTEPTDQEYAEAYAMYEVNKALPTLVEQQHLFRVAIKDQIMNGYLNPLEFYRQAKIIIEAIEDLKKDPDIFDCAYNEREKFGKDKAIINGAVIEVGQRSTPDYKSCNDPVYNRLKEELSAREKLLKNLPPEGMADLDTGEIIKPPVTKISTYITVKI